MSSRQARAARRRLSRLLTIAATALLSACATSSSIRMAERAEAAQDYDRAVVEYTKIVRAHPDDVNARTALGRAKLRAAQDHAARGRRLAGLGRYEDALVEYQLASELNPTDSQIDAALKDVRERVKTKVAVTRGNKTELQSLIERASEEPPAGLELPDGAKLPGSLVFNNGATASAVFRTIARFANINLIFDPAYRDQPLSIDLHNSSLADALSALTASTHTFYRVTAPRTVTIVPDTPSKRREYEESVVQTFYLSNVDIKEAIDALRVVLDIRQISPITATNAVTIKDTPERIAAAAKLISAIDKARPEVAIDVQLLEVDRTRLQEYGLQIASPGQAGISGSADVNRDNFALANLSNLTAADVLLTGVPALYYRLLKDDTSTRTLANPQLWAAEGVSATARFGDRIPVPITTFAPIAAGGVNTQPITSYTYENIGVNIEITPRTHHDDEVTLALKISVSNQSGTGFGGLPTFGNREIETTIRLKDGETNMLAGLIRDDERSELAGVPGLSDVPVIGRLFAKNHKDTQQTDIILTLTPHIVRVLNVSEADLRPFRLERDISTGTGDTSTVPGGPSRADTPEIPLPVAPPVPAAQAPPPTPFPQPLQGAMPGIPQPVSPLPKKPEGGS
jgi:general secretion pathway protein D